MADLQDAAPRTADQSDRRPALVALGGVLGAIAAASCCLVPLALFGLGAGGAWIGNLTALAPYQPIFIVLTLGCLGAGYWMVYRKPRMAFSDGAVCTRPASGRLVRVALWSATVLVVAAAAFPYYGPLLLGV